VNILFSMRHLGSFRMYESAVRLLGARGHTVHIVVDRGERLGWNAALAQLMADCPTVTWSWAPRQRRTVWLEFSRIIRIWLDYLRYFDVCYASAPVLRRRAAERMPRVLERVTRVWPLRTAGGLAWLRRTLQGAERALPRVRELDAAIQEQMPDVLLLTPLIYLGSPQLDMLRSAHAAGVKTVFCVGSWDHLSSKAVIRDIPHRVFVWNATQKREAVELHSVPQERVIVTGAQCYDHWFGRTPSRSREAFCARVGLRADRPFVLWVCSALFQGSPAEAVFVASWIESLRQHSSPVLREVGVMIRPHPTRQREWENVDVRQHENVTLYGSMPADEEAKNDYFDSLYYSSAVVGLNTSAFLEAAIVGRPVLSILLPEFHDNQEGTIHFHYLLDVGGGLVRIARDFATHHEQLAAVLNGSGRDDKPAFVEAFLRPHGLDVPASGVFVSSVEAVAALPAGAPVREGALVKAVRVLMLPLAIATRLALRTIAEGEDKTSREIHGARIKDERARERVRKQRLAEEAERVRQQQRDREKAVAIAGRMAAKERQRRDRDRRAAESRRLKLEMRRRKDRAKHARQRRKRRDALRHRIMQKLGLA
jgi:hypothetical protein